jgi:hypothetical protein
MALDKDGHVGNILEERPTRADYISAPTPSLAWSLNLMNDRPSDFRDEIATRICDLLMDGVSLRSICGLEDMPGRTTVFRWMDENPDFASRYARARMLQADLMDDLILETANACTPATAQADKVKIAAFQWRASKLMPKVYGDKTEVAVAGPKGGPVQSERVIVPVNDPIEAARVYQKVMGEG